MGTFIVMMADSLGTENNIISRRASERMVSVIE